MASTKYIFVTGGVTSSLGKGIISASLATLLQARGYRVTIQPTDQSPAVFFRQKAVGDQGDGRLRRRRRRVFSCNSKVHVS